MWKRLQIKITNGKPPWGMSHPKFSISFFMIIIYSSTKELILKYSICALKNLNVEFLLEFVQKEDMENLL